MNAKLGTALSIITGPWRTPWRAWRPPGSTARLRHSYM